MNINFNLKDKKAKETSIRIIITHLGRVYHKGTGVSVPVSSWSVAKQKCNIIDKERRLKDIRIYLESNLSEDSTPEDIKRVLNKSIIPASERDGKFPTFWQEFDSYNAIKQSSKSSMKFSGIVLAKYMGRDFNWEDVTYEFFCRLQEKMQNEKKSANTIKTIVAHLRSTMHRGCKKGYHKNLDYLNFTTPMHIADHVYLTKEEVDKLANLKLTKKSHIRCRNTFLIGVYTGARYSDYSKFTKDNIEGDKLVYTQLKTGTKVILPLSPIVKQLLPEKLGKVYLDSYFNTLIRSIAKLAGIDTLVEKNQSKGTETIITRVPKYELITSHTARRTAITLLHQSGVNDKDLMNISGHKSLTAFERYLKTTQEDTAIRLADNPFFQ